MTYFSPFFSFRVEPSKQTTGIICLAISAKKIKRAVDRNRAKRLFREAIRRTKFKARPNQKFFLYGQKPAETATLGQLQKEFIRLNENNFS